mmetsp:Transcript_16553/g.47124  ORF Transcript_16553/g.47124 Transcript_16553/m.47124 type:complete len:245 (+) Transcript_16553:2090-2824(+)
MSFSVCASSGYSLNGKAKSSSPLWAISYLRTHWARWSLAKRNRSSATSGSTPGTPGPALIQLSLSLSTSFLRTFLLTFRFFFWTCCLLLISSALTEAVATIFRQPLSSTVRLSTSDLSMKPDGKLRSSMAYISSMGRISMLMPDSRSRIVLKSAIMTPKASRSSSATTFSSFTDVALMYSDRSSSFSRASLCRLLQYVFCQTSTSAFNCPLSWVVLRDNAPMLWHVAICPMSSSVPWKLLSWEA